MTETGFIADLWRILTFQAGYNTAVVLAGSIVLGAAAGLIGAIVFLRKRSLMSDSISHSTLPGVGLAFLLGVAMGGSGRNLMLLMLGASATALLGVFSVQWIRDHTRLAEDAAIGTVLSVYYGFGIVLLSIIQSLDLSGQAGLNSFLLGAVASLRLEEAWMIAIVSGVCLLITVLLLKEFLLLCFDQDYAAAGGWPVTSLDLVLMGLLLTVVSVGLTTVGMVLIIAVVIIPGVAARFWTERAGLMIAIAALIGALSAMVGVAISALVDHAPTGAVIVLTAGGFFTLSLLFGTARGVLFSLARMLVWRERVRDCQLLKAARGSPVTGSARGNRLRRAGWLDASGRLTEEGEAHARALEARLLRLEDGVAS